MLLLGTHQAGWDPSAVLGGMWGCPTAQGTSPSCAPGMEKPTPSISTLSQPLVWGLAIVLLALLLPFCSPSRLRARGLDQHGPEGSFSEPHSQGPGLSLPRVRGYHTD